eukprot:TRINITY_DN3792_c0_g1_i2.p1 TRINITY_DN3792_c0_g1~~TRINITY_DN3792_c0_g1_i2.p1  ORF type:complete len:157 (+),score=42.01 TRINITY_DN3792_c0_g1_i2:329-799(+)
MVFAATFETEMSLVLRKSLESIILCSLHPRTSIQVTVQVLNDDGSTLAAALNASCLALLDAGISMKSVVAGCSLVVSGARIVADPTLAEETGAQTTVTLGFDNISDGPIVANSIGPLDSEVFWTCLDLAQDASLKIIDFYRIVMSKKNERIRKLLE